MKFGGTSVGSKEGLESVLEIVKTESAKGVRVCVVVSAASGVTNMLVSLYDEVLKGGRPDLSGLRSRLHGLVQEMPIAVPWLDDLLEKLAHELEDLARYRADEGGWRRDRILSYGERCSAPFVAALLTTGGVQSYPADAADYGMVTNANFGSADVDLEEVSKTLRDGFRPFLSGGPGIPVVTGFIGRTQDGRRTTLGRGGSDYTAAILGAAFSAVRIEIWTDANGVMTADPRMVGDVAETVPRISASEAAELADGGGKVLHPSTMRPAALNGIPILVKNTMHPAHGGTLVYADGDPDRGVGDPLSIVSRRNVVTITMTAASMCGTQGFLATAMKILADRGISVDLVATSEVSVTCSVDDSRMLGDAIEAIRTATSAEVVKRNDLGLVCVIAVRSPGSELLSDVFRVMKESFIKVLGVSLAIGAPGCHLLLSAEDVPRAVKVLHRAFFE